MKKMNIILLSVLVLIEPFLDTYFMYNNPCLEFFGFKLSTIIRYTLLGLIIILLFIQTRFKKNRKILIIYAILLIGYYILHYFNATNFNSLIPGNFDFSWQEEILYLSRYAFPLFLIYYINNIELNEKCFKRTLIIYSLIVSLSVIVSNIFLLARSSYYDFNISYNIFDWFFKEISYANASTRGFFYATIVMTPLLLITPYIYSLYYKEKKYLYLTVIVFNMLALFMAGTKACTLGFMIVALMMLFIYLFFTLIKKELQFNFGHLLVTIVIIAIGIGLLPISPTMQRVYLTNEMYQNSESDSESKPESELKDPDNQHNNPSNTITNESDLEEVDISQYTTLEEIYDIENEEKREKTIKKYIYINKDKIGIMSYLFINSYSYLYDYNFWADIILNESDEMKANNRYIQARIFDRIKEINDSPLDDYMGITYSRTSKIFNLERDFLYQYYSLGIIGTILLLGPLVLLLIICIISILINKEKLNMKNTSLCLGVGLLLCAALYSGNMLDNLGITIILGYVLGYLVTEIFKNNSIT